MLTLTALLLPAVSAPAEEILRQWESHTSFGRVQEMVVYNGDVWVATLGGLVRIDPQTMTHQTYTNVNGLGTNQLYSLCVDARNRLWVGGRGRLINYSNPNQPDGYLLTDKEGGFIEVYDIVSSPVGDSLWLADRLGVTLFLPSNDLGEGLILDTYTRFGEIERGTQARRLALDDNNVWVGTDKGFAIGDRSDVRQLKTPSGWISFFPTQMTAAVDADSVKGLVIKDDTVYIGGRNAVFRLQTDPDTQLIDLAMYGSPIIYNMTLVGDSVFVHSERSSQFYFDGRFSELPWDSMPIPHSTAGVIDNDGSIWNGNLLYGIYRLEGDHFILYETGGTPVNDCRRLIAAQGKIWGAFWSAGLAYYDDGRWTTVDNVFGLVNSLGVGPRGELWVGTWGAGAWRIESDSISHFDQTNSSLSGNPDSPSFVVISDIISTGDAVWLANLEGVGGELSAVNPYDLEQWRNFTLIGGSSAEWVTSLTAGQGVVYTGSLNNGIYAILYSGTPFDLEDDYRWEFTSSNSAIGSDIISCLEVDGYDSLWAGTSFGLSYQALGEIFFRNVNVPDSFGPQVTAIAFDGQGSLYAGSNLGLAIRDIATGAFEHLTSRNSGLVDDVINDIYYQEEADVFWIATANGISEMKMPYKLATRDVDQVLAYPNPFVIRFGNETVRFNFSGLAKIQIFTLAGELVREIPVSGVWDGNNNNNEPVTSGVYLFNLTSGNGDTGQGKLLLIRE